MEWWTIIAALLGGLGIGTSLTSLVTYFLTERSKQKEREWNAKQKYNDRLYHEKVSAYLLFLRYFGKSTADSKPLFKPDFHDVMSDDFSETTDNEITEYAEVSAQINLYGHPDLQSDMEKLINFAIEGEDSNFRIEDAEALRLQVIKKIRAELRQIK